MIKIKSISDVITNSSDEVLILKTDENPDIVNDWINKNTKGGCCNIHRFESTKDSLLRWLVGYGDLFDPNSKKSMMNYHLSHVLNTFYKVTTDENTWMSTYEYIPGSIELIESWIIFLRRNKYRINKYHIRNYYGLKDQNLSYKEAIKLGYRPLFDSDDWLGYWDRGEDYEGEKRYYVSYPLEYLDRHNFPYGLYERFIKHYKGPKPSTWELPKELDINTYIGKIGLESSDENSIDYDDIVKICKKFNGEHFHMG